MLKVALVWHMHQPDYTDPGTGESLMPWTWLHAVKDYGEMLRTLEAVPGMVATFNLVPTLIEQLQHYEKGVEQDRWLRLLQRNPNTFSPEDRQSALEHFFSVHQTRHVQPWPRYQELHEMRHGGVEAFTDQDLRDLQVWFLLSWTGYWLRKESDFIQQLFNHHRHFDESDKHQLLEICQQEVRSILPRYRQLESEGRIELSITPFAHPILPLVIDTDIAKEASTGEPLPEPPFQSAADAALQVDLAIERSDAVLGEKSRGFWPAEGAVSEAALTLLKAKKVPWAATDEGILAKSIPGGLQQRSALYRPWQWQGLPIVFRDRELSDRVGFVYADWEPNRAADDLLKRLKKVASNPQNEMITLILDGENCWERYRENGWPFLNALYQGLIKTDAIAPVTVSQGITTTNVEPLQRVRPGSWINADFGIWIGHPEENKGWDLLRQARHDLSPYWKKSGQAAKEDRSRLAFLRAEGSDWFWWYGDDHTTAQAGTFDLLFRRHLQAAYHEAGLTPPIQLYEPIKQIEQDNSHPPHGPVQPRLEAECESFLDWRGAGRTPLDRSSAMHGAAEGWHMLEWGADDKWLYLRFTPAGPSSLNEPQNLRVRIEGGTTWELQAPTEGNKAQLKEQSSSLGIPWHCDTTLRIALPLGALLDEKTSEIAISLHRFQQAQEVGRWPAEGPARIASAELEPQHFWAP